MLSAPELLSQMSANITPMQRHHTTFQRRQQRSATQSRGNTGDRQTTSTSSTEDNLNLQRYTKNTFDRRRVSNANWKTSENATKVGLSRSSTSWLTEVDMSTCGDDSLGIKLLLCTDSAHHIYLDATTTGCSVLSDNQQSSVTFSGSKRADDVQLIGATLITAMGFSADQCGFDGDINTIIVNNSNHLPKNRSLFDDSIVVTTSSKPSATWSPSMPSKSSLPVTNAGHKTATDISLELNSLIATSGFTHHTDCTLDRDNLTDYSNGRDEQRGATTSVTEFNRIDLFFRSLATRVFVARSSVTLYISGTRVTDLPVTSEAGTLVTNNSGWTHHGSGIPVLVFDTGEGSRRDRALSIVLADPLTGFITWSQKIDHLSHYRSPANTFDVIEVLMSSSL